MFRFELRRRGAHREVVVIDRAQPPSREEARGEIQDGGEVHLASATNQQLRGIADRPLIRACHTLSIQHVAGDTSAGVIVAGSGAERLTDPRGYADGLG